MFTVRCPAALLWHPSVHRSLLLLRALQRPHTLLLDPSTTARGRLSVPLLSEGATEIRTHAPPVTEVGPANLAASGRGVVLYRVDDILLYYYSCTPMLHGGEAPVATVSEHLAERTATLLAYLEASAVCDQVDASIDALLVSLNAGDLETIRQTHARVMELVARLEMSIRDESHDNEEASPRAEPLSTWPLFCTMQFLIDEAGLLTSAFPQISQAYARLSSTCIAVTHHRRLIQQTVEQQLQASGRTGDSATDTEQRDAAVEMRYPVKGFLRDVQRHLASYNRSIEDLTLEGVSGEKGALRSRVSAGRFGMQAVPAHLPWPLQGRPLRKP